jgi:enoyl-CoA hydratase/carnithine racemase
VTIEKSLGPDKRIALVRFDRGDGINAFSKRCINSPTPRAGFEDDSETSVTGCARAFSAGFDLKDAESWSCRIMTSRCAGT